MKGNTINPMDRPCCANCRCLVITDYFHRELKFEKVGCPHSDGVAVREISSLFDLVCNSWECRGKPFNYDGASEV